MKSCVGCGARYQELLSYRAAVFFPYEPALLTFQELYAKNMPVFAPARGLGLFYQAPQPTPFWRY